MAYKSIVYMAELLGTDSNGVRKLARALKVKRYKNGTIEMYDEEFLRISTLPYDLIGLINFIYSKEYKLGDVIKLLNNPKATPELNTKVKFKKGNRVNSSELLNI